MLVWGGEERVRFRVGVVRRRGRQRTRNWNSSFPSAQVLPAGGKPKRTLTSIVCQEYGDCVSS